MGMRSIFLFFSLSLTIAAQAAMWRNQDQIGHDLFLQKKYEAAYQHFKDLRWKAVAAYKAGRVKEAASLFKTGSEVEDWYNLGNSLALSGDLVAAKKAYRQALSLAPQHQDAKYNLDLIEKLEQQKNQQKSDKNKQESEQNKQESEQNKQESEQNKQESEQNKQESEQNKQESEQNKQESEQNKQESEQNKQESEQNKQESEQNKQESQEMKDWLKLIETDPEGLLRQKFLRDYQRELEGKS